VKRGRVCLSDRYNGGDGDHVHIFLEAPPRYSPAEIVQLMKSISAREGFKKFSNLRKQLWARELRNCGYFVRSVRDMVIADIIREYIEYQKHETDSNQLRLFERT
jgi:putative transposase